MRFGSDDDGVRRTFVIAEAGVNHDGSLDAACELVRAAARAGADAVKFQTFSAKDLALRSAPKAEYQKQTTSEAETQHDMLRRLELGRDAHAALQKLCAEQRIEFISSPFDRDSLRLLVELGVPRLKLGSGELTNAPLLWDAARSGLPVILSTGMATLAEVEEALGVFARADAGEERPRARDEFVAALRQPGALARLRDRVTLLHCTTQYPSPAAAANLRAMRTMALAFGLPVGYSDHTTGIGVPLAAVALGATVIEKHLTLDRTLPGPDHAASAEPDELAQMIDEIRAVEAALGKGEKIPAECELSNIVVARKSVVTTAAVPRGATFTEQNLSTKRPATGASAMRYFDWLGKTAERDHAADEVLE